MEAGGLDLLSTPPAPYICVYPTGYGSHVLSSYTNTHVEQNLKVNAMSFLTSKIRDDERQNLFNVKYIAVSWQIFCCFFVTRKFYQKVIYFINMYGGI